ncbi:MAG: response regulator [Desulfobacterales bacterium]|nr:response regulator [Desulfobacterales bacterium]
MKKGTILIVDDTPANLGVLFDYLESKGFRVLVDTSGESALRAIKQMQPDIILLDVMMPGIDGFETCRRLKEDEETKGIPVIFMTALTDAVDEVKGLSIGAVDYITKPIQVETVMARVDTHMTIRKLQRTVEETNKLLEVNNKLLHEKNAELEEALSNIKMLKGLVPICGKCKKIRDDNGFWNQLETYIEKHSEVLFSHGLCPECMDELYGEQEWYIKSKRKEE